MINPLYPQTAPTAGGPHDPNYVPMLVGGSPYPQNQWLVEKLNA